MINLQSFINITLNIIIEKNTDTLMQNQHKIRTNQSNETKRRNTSQINRFLVNFDDS